MQRFYIEGFTYEKEDFSVRDKNIVYQLVKVLRTRIGDEIIIFNGNDPIDYVCSVKDFSKKEIELVLVNKIEKNSDNQIEINLFQGLPNKLDKVEYILQKGVEVGVSNFNFFRSERSQKLAISDKKKERLERIIVEAVEQCGGNIIPKLNLDSDTDFKEENFENTNIFMHTINNNSQSLQDFIWVRGDKNIIKLNIFVGPEGGFSENEINDFEEKKFSRIHLGNRILRTETAGVATAFTLLQML